jgi:hypothetical protein
MQRHKRSESTVERSLFTRRLLQASAIAVVGAFAMPAQADYATCAELGAAQEAYCINRGTPIPDGIYWTYDAGTDICTLYGC